MFVRYVIMLMISCTADLHLCIGETFNVVKRTVAFFFEESGSQKRALGPMTTV